MAGHSKWAKLKHGKESRDREKGNIFGKLTRAITMSVINGGRVGDPDKNALLRMSIDKAKQHNVPKDNIQRAIERALGPDQESLKEVTYEAFGPAGSALLIKATTDNPNRTHSQVKIILDKSGGKLAGQGAVAYMFQGTSPLYPVNVNEPEAEDIKRLIERLEVLDDVDTVYTNATI